MPRIGVFYGIEVEMFHGDHAPPHFHAKYGGDSVLVDIDPIRVSRGRLPIRAPRMVIEWATLHQHELIANWEKAERLEPLLPIDPLP